MKLDQNGLLRWPGNEVPAPEAGNPGKRDGGACGARNPGKRTSRPLLDAELPAPDRTSSPERMIGLGSELDVGVDAEADADADADVFVDFDDSPPLLADPDDAGVVTRELLDGDSVRRRLLLLPPLRLSSSSLASSSTAVTDVDNDDTFDDSDDRPLL